MARHLVDEEPSNGDKCNGERSKTLKTSSSGEITIKTPQKLRRK